MLILLAIVFVVVFAILAGVSFYFYVDYLNPEPTIVQKRLQEIKDINKSKLSEGGTERLSQFLKKGEYTEDRIGKIVSQLSFTKGYKTKLRQAGIEIPVDRFVLFFIFLPAACLILIAYILSMSALILFIAFIPIVINFVLSFKIANRLKLFNEQLPEALALMNSALRAGHSFQSAVGMVASEMKDPIKKEFSEFMNDLNLGIQVKESIAKMVNNVNIPDVRMFATAIMIQREAGGNLTEILNNLSTTIRERFKMNRQIMTLTAQARITGNVLSVAPLGVLLFMAVFQADYMMPFINHPTGQIALLVSGVLQILGYIIISNLVKVRI